MIIGFQIGERHCLIDIEDVDLLERTWRPAVSKGGEVVYLRRGERKGTHGRYNTILLHRVIMARVVQRELLRNEDVDHRNRDGLDNTRENLRIATRNQNRANSTLNKNNASGYKGVSWCKRERKFVAHIGVNGKRKSLGYYPTAELAHAAYVDAAKKYYGDFARGTND